MGRHQKVIVSMASAVLVVVACLSVGIGSARAQSCSGGEVSDVLGWQSYVTNILTMLARETPTKALGSTYTTTYAGRIKGDAFCPSSDGGQACIDCMNRLQIKLQAACPNSASGNADDGSTSSCTMSFYKI
ncbi:unnamed protein product [Linum trigynum]|uniref:Gnk2-homologous domain-containing protein n=1 Tax=Linum trigynum TaxID=586398 RepID=A0AAV2DWV8_9ROSI